jgi:hypothetical protein
MTSITDDAALVSTNGSNVQYCKLWRDGAPAPSKIVAEAEQQVN